MRSSSLTYDQVPYPWLSYSDTHPDSLAALARLGGMTPAPVECCRVLELGCASGGNLIPMAYALPESELVGIDLAETQIQVGQNQAKALGLNNLTLQALDILDFPEELGQFDYIIAHGVYSWVPGNVQEKVLEICARHLAPQGVAFVSYNTYPGWHWITVARDLMRYYTRKISDPQVRAETARAVLHDFANSHSDDQNDYFNFLKMYSAYLIGGAGVEIRKSDSALLHDDLEDLNQPLYFHQFIEQAEQHQLQYLADLCFQYGDNQTLKSLKSVQPWYTNLIEMEQAGDFLVNRTFRRTLLCHADVTINRQVTPATIQNFCVASFAQPENEKPNLPLVSVETFKGLDGSVFTIDHPVSKAAMLCLIESWPQALPFHTLLTAARARLDDLGRPSALPLEQDAQILGANLLRAYHYSRYLVELHTYQPGLIAQVTERPLASRTARQQAERQGGSENWVTNLWHERVTLEEMDRFLLVHLNGENTRSDLVNLLIQGPLAEGALSLVEDGEPVPADRQTALLEQELDQRLNWLAKSALLVDPVKLGR